MPPSVRLSLACVVAICLISPVTAENGTPLRQPVPLATRKADTLTGKERLGPKWTDEQRIDNCNVPPGKRGAKARPAVCPDHPTN
jgi:hypothetical protein